MRSIKRRNLKLLVVGLIIVLAAILRFWQLDLNPPHLNWDEVSHGYNAYSILTTGKDVWGENFLQTSFRAFGDYKLPVYIYLTVPSVAIFGLNEWGVRIPVALFGILAVLGTFLLTPKLFRNYWIASISALLLAVSPWHLLLSRAAFEANVAVTLVIFGVYFFLLGLEKSKYFLFSTLLFGLSLYTYYATRVVVPILVLGLLIIYWPKIKLIKKQILAPLLIFVLFLVSIIPSSLSTEGQARFYWATILDQGAINRINEARNSSDLPQILNIAVNNKPIYFISHFIPNYLSHFSPIFLFFEGGSNFQYSIPGRGVLYFFEIPLIILGILALIRQKNAITLLILFWLLAGPIAASATRESPNVLRSIPTLPVYQMIGAFGFFQILKNVNKKTKIILITTFIILVSISTVLLVRDYWGDYRKNYSWAWQYGYKQVSQFVSKHKDRYDRIVITKKYGEPHEFLLFYQKIDPKFYQTDPKLIRCPRSNWFWVDQFNGYEFVNDWEIVNLKKDQILPAACPRDAKNLEVEKMLLVTSPGNFPSGGRLIKTIKFLNGEPVFDLIEY